MLDDLPLLCLTLVAETLVNSSSKKDIARDVLSLWLTSRNVRKRLAIPIAILAPQANHYERINYPCIWSVYTHRIVRQQPLIIYKDDNPVLLSKLYYLCSETSRSDLTRVEVVKEQKDAYCPVCCQKPKGKTYSPWRVEGFWGLQCNECTAREWQVLPAPLTPLPSTTTLFMCHNCNTTPIIAMACGCVFHVTCTK